ncbi:hypothetical protein SNE40_017908 [Patella caerulea]|uniref:Beta-lactamase-related domain-containing protein n=1 Tax=Patella caerulea TaxID=87958 RepID=A0AAN8PQJ0_PATCE
MAKLSTLLGVFVTSCLLLAGCHGTNDEFGTKFQQFLDEHNYNGGSVAAMKDGKLVYANGFGVDRFNNAIHAGTMFPVSSVSKSLTAVAIMQLAEKGVLSLEQTIFGKGGVLHMIKPYKKVQDPRIHDITIRHLLHHTAGWDLNKPPIYDPVMNSVYISRGHKVPDILKVMKDTAPLTPYDTMRYMISQKLDFTPGTKMVYSNFGYLILGRIIEEVADTGYEDYIKHNILIPCGMWHTRIGPVRSNAEIINLGTSINGPNGPIDKFEDSDVSLYDILNPEDMDSALGWQSNVYDMMRFVKCLDTNHHGKLLNPTFFQKLLLRPVAAPIQHSDTWYGAGFKVNSHSAIWTLADPHTDDLILYHKTKDTSTEKESHSVDSFVFLLNGKGLQHLKHKAHDLVSFVDVKAVSHPFYSDLSDIHNSTGYKDVIIKYKVDEHHLDAYVSALKQENLDIKWISASDRNGHTCFTLLAEPFDLPAKYAMDYIVQHGLMEKKLLHHKIALEAEGYNMTFLQNYMSASHDSRHAFLAIFRKGAYDEKTHMKFGIHHFPRPYMSLMGLYLEKGYHPLVQSYIMHDDEEKISFVFLKRTNTPKVNFKTYYGLSSPQLQRTVKQNGKADRKLSYLDVSNVYGKPKFSAVFTNENAGKWVFQLGMKEASMEALVMKKQKFGFLPKIVIGYTDKDQIDKYAIYLEKSSVL